MNYTVHPILNGFFTVAFSSDNNIKFPKVENIPSFSFLIIDENNIPLLVDTGFDLNHIPGPNSRGIKKEEHHLEYNLKKYGFAVKDIKTVIQTHLHWDHAANIGLFTEAEIFIQKSEIAGLFNLRENEETSYCPYHWIDSLERFRLVDGDCEIKPGINIIRSSGHTEGHQSVQINTADKTVLLIGDSPFTYEWLWTLVPDELWASFRSGDGERFFWQDKLAGRISKWLEDQAIYTCHGNNSNNGNKEEIKIFSHDPGLIGKETI
jgi:glyoxylase-like metal-dependent hydrolase (beta-lactamase superfamily II)